MSLPVHLVDSLVGVTPGSVVEVTGDEAHHAVAVRRLREGEQVVLTDGLGTSATGAVASGRPASRAVASRWRSCPAVSRCARSSMDSRRSPRSNSWCGGCW